MKIYFWGVRGSISTPLTPNQVREKINAVIARISLDDSSSTASKKRFIQSLPPDLYGTVGGNTACVELIDSTGTHLILDAGTGIRVLAKESELPEDKTYHFLFSHFHWDHIQGFPFFDHAYNKNFSLHFHSVSPDFLEKLGNQMEAPYFPVQMKSMEAKTTLHHIDTEKPFQIGSLTIMAKKMKHPGGSYAYAFSEGGKKFIYATDAELSVDDFERTEQNIAFFENADSIVVDAQYTFEEAITKANWGHSPFCYAVDFADAWKIKSLYLFHHEPTYDDAKLGTILQAAREYAQLVSDTNINIFLADEGLELDL